MEAKGSTGKLPLNTGNIFWKILKVSRRGQKAGVPAPSVRRVHIPKPGSTETRPIGIPTFEDKVLQRAVVMVLEPIYEQRFQEQGRLGHRPGHSEVFRYARSWETPGNFGEADR